MYPRMQASVAMRPKDLARSLAAKLFSDDPEAKKGIRKAYSAVDNRGQMSPSRGVNMIVTVFIAAIVGAFLMPVAIDQLVSTDTSSWGDGAASLWNILDVIVVLALFLFFIGAALYYSDRI